MFPWYMARLSLNFVWSTGIHFRPLSLVLPLAISTSDVLSMSLLSWCSPRVPQLVPAALQHTHPVPGKAWPNSLPQIPTLCVSCLKQPTLLSLLSPSFLSIVTCLPFKICLRNKAHIFFPKVYMCSANCWSASQTCLIVLGVHGGRDSEGMFWLV